MASVAVSISCWHRCNMDLLPQRTLHAVCEQGLVTEHLLSALTVGALLSLRTLAFTNTHSTTLTSLDLSDGRNGSGWLLLQNAAPRMLCQMLARAWRVWGTVHRPRKQSMSWGSGLWELARQSFLKGKYM